MLSPKILHLITLSELGGAQRACARTVLGLKAHGYEVDVACKPGGWLEDHLRAQGIRVFPLREMDRQIDLSKDAETLRTCSRLIRSERYQLVHCHSTKAGVIGRIAAMSVGVPSVFTAHGWAFSEGVPAKRRVLALLVEAVLAQITSRIICVSEYDRQLALRWRIAPPDRIRLIHNGIEDIENIEGIEDIGKPFGAQPSSGTVRIVMIARFAAPKDHRGLLRACAIAGGDIQIILRGGWSRHSGGEGACPPTRG